MNRQSSAPVGDAEWLRELSRQFGPARRDEHERLNRIADTLDRRGDVEKARYLETHHEITEAMIGIVSLHASRVLMDKLQPYRDQLSVAWADWMSKSIKVEDAAMHDDGLSAEGAG